MHLDIRSHKQARAPTALKLNNIAFSHPVLLKTIDVGKLFCIVEQTRQFAFDFKTAPLPVCFPFLVLEGDCAFVTIELAAVEFLHRKSMDVFAKVMVAAAVWA